MLSGIRLPKHEEEDLSPWWNVFREEEVLPLTPAEARSLIVEPARRLFRFDEAAIQRILGLSQNKPMEVQRLCSDVLNFKYTNNRRSHRITEEELMESVRSPRPAPQRNKKHNKRQEEKWLRVTEPR